MVVVAVHGMRRPRLSASSSIACQVIASTRGCTDLGRACTGGRGGSAGHTSAPVTWLAVLLTAALCFALKLAGWLVPPRALDDPRVRRAAALLPVALLAGLVVVQVLGSGRSLTVDARLAGLLAGGVALALRAPFLVVVVVAAATAALLRAVG